MAIFTGGIILLLSSVWLVRSQVTVTGVDYMEGKKTSTFLPVSDMKNFSNLFKAT